MRDRLGRAVAAFLGHPLTRGADLDDPRTTALRRRIIREKIFLNRVYREWYSSIAGALPGGPGAILELGSGAGFFAEVVPRAITSEVFPCAGVHLVADGAALPIVDGCLQAVVMTDVFHHLPDVGGFLRDAARAVRPGGRIIMIEPWVTSWSTAIYRHLHHEPFEPAAAWSLPAGGPLSVANGALPWIVFERDRARFAAEHQAWRVLSVTVQMPFRYLLSGGVSMRALAPGWSFAAWRAVEGLLQPWNHHLGMFALIVLERCAEGE
jgi:SAM-dependent methyltransferase